VTLETGRSTIRFQQAGGVTAVNEASAVRWASGDLYEPYMGRWSRRVAREFLDWLNAPAGIDWLDVGCGTGVVAEAIAERSAPRRLVLQLSFSFPSWSAVAISHREGLIVAI